MKFALLLAVIIFATRSFAQDAGTASTEPTPVVSGPATAPELEAEGEASSTEDKKGEPAVIKMLQEKYNLSAEDIAKYRSEKLGYGQIRLMAEFAKASGKSMDEVVALLKEKRSIREVARELKLTKEDIEKIKKEMKGMREERKEKRVAIREGKKERKEIREERQEKRQERRENRQERRQDRKEDRRQR